MSAEREALVERAAEALREVDNKALEDSDFAFFTATYEEQARAALDAVEAEVRADERRRCVEAVEALAGTFEHFRDGLRARPKPTTMDRREANTWDVAAYRLRAALSGLGGEEVEGR